MSDLQKFDPGPTKKLRTEVIERLKDNYAHDYLEEDVFEKRISVAMNTDSKGELLSLVEDLPKDHSSMVPGRYSINSGKVDSASTIFTIMGSIKRRGVWKPSRYSNAICVMGEADLDFTEAQIPPGVSDLNIFCMMGEVNIIVPQGINVESKGIPVMADFSDTTIEQEDPNAPTLRVKAFVLMGEVNIRYPKKKKERVWGWKKS
jgi:hypothetical protein